MPGWCWVREPCCGTGFGSETRGLGEKGFLGKGLTGLGSCMGIRITFCLGILSLFFLFFFFVLVIRLFLYFSMFCFVYSIIFILIFLSIHLSLSFYILFYLFIYLKFSVFFCIFIYLFIPFCNRSYNDYQTAQKKIYLLFLSILP